MKSGRRFASLAVVALVTTCKSSTGPTISTAGTVLGTWHVTSGALSSGTLSPTTFDITVGKVGSAYVVTLPTLTWSVGPLAFSTQAHIVPFIDTTLFVVEELPVSPTLPCEFITIGGRKNATVDTVMSATVEVFDSDTSAGPSCAPSALAFAVETK